MKLTGIGRSPLKSLQNRKICGTTSKVKNIKLNLKKVIDFLMKYKKVFLNICRPKEDASLDSFSCLISNYYKYQHKLKFLRLFKDILTNVFRVLANSSWVKELYQEWSLWKNKVSTFPKRLMSIKVTKKVMLRNGCFKLKE